jgi:hypothetical protein
VLRLLASGRLAEARTLVTASGEPGLVGLAGLVAETDVRARGLAVDVPEIQAVLEQVEAGEPPDSRLRFWVLAVLAEQMLVNFDPAAFVVTQQAREELRRLDLPTLPPLALRYARARLTRADSMRWLLLPTPDGLARHRSLRDQAVTDLLACGFIDEVHVTRGLTAGLMATTLMEDVRENYARLLDARAALRDDAASMWPAVLDSFIAIVASDIGDLAAALEAFDRIEQRPHRYVRLDVVAAYGRASFRLVTRGASRASVAHLEQALTDVRRHDPRMAQAWHSHAANTLADLGSPAAAHFARLEAELPAVGPVHEIDREILRMRVAALHGAIVPAEDAIGVLARLQAHGHVRQSGRQALRLAHDLARTGALAPAARLHAWGQERVPAGARATLWERWWARPLRARDHTVPMPTSSPPAPPTVAAAPGPAATGPGSTAHADGTRLELRVMTPALDVTLDGATVELSDTQAKLLLALVMAHPVPLHVEQVSDLLWPATSPTDTRYRLNSLVHRLRRALGRHGDAVVRTGPLLRVDADRCDVDLWRFRSSLADSPPVRRHALTTVRGNLCDAQFPYEDRFQDERHRLCSQWIHHARRALRAGEVDLADLDPALAALNLAPSDL